MRKRVAWIVLVALTWGGTLHCGINDSMGPWDFGDGGDERADIPADHDVDVPVLDDVVIEGPACSSGDLAAALAAAHNGATVEIGSGCEIEGSFHVPAGVSLLGHTDPAGPPTLRSAPDDRRPVLTLRPSATPTVVSNLQVVSSSNYGIVAIGSDVGALELKDLAVESSRGVGVGIETLATLQLTNLTLRGPYTATELRRADPTLADPDTMATHGLVVVRGGAVTVENLTIAGFAAIGAILIDDDITWSTGAVEGNGLAGLVTHAGTTRLTGVEFTGLRSPHAFPLDTTFDETRSWTGPPTFGAVFLGGTAVTTNGVSVERGLHFGLAHAGGTALHDGLTVRNCGDTGVWAQDVLSFTLRGTPDVPALLEDNHFAGVMLYEPDTTVVADLDVIGTAYGCHGCGTLDEVQAGDGIQVVLPKTSVDLRGVDLVDNARIGLLLDMGGTNMTGVTISAVEVSSSAMAFGAYAQNATAADDWDASVVRLGELGGYDNGLEGTLLPIGGRLPPKAFPALSRLIRDGLIGMIDPEPPH